MKTMMNNITLYTKNNCKSYFIRLRTFGYFALLVFFLASCSTTKNLAEGEVLYTGIKKTQVENKSNTETGKTAMAEVNAALAKAPNNSLFGSSRLRIPFPLGLWIYNEFVNSNSGIGRWIFRRFAATPVYISTVNPEVRTNLATNLLHDYGFFNGTVDYQILPHKNNDKKAKIQYYVDMRNPYFLDSISYNRFPEEAMAMINRSETRTLLHRGDQFNVIDLENERQRLSTLFRNRGYYFFRSDFIGYLADTTRVRGLVDLQVVPKAGIHANATKQWYVGDIAVEVHGSNGEAPNDSIMYEDLKILYHDELKVRPKVLQQRFRFDTGQLYSQQRSSRTQQRFAELGIFRYTEMQFAPRDTTAANNILDVRVRAGLDLPYDGEFRVNLATKSNDYAGPGASLNVTKRNVFRGGETFSIGLTGSYEWQTKSYPGGARVNSWELGINSSLTFPWIVFPWLNNIDFDYPATTTFSVNADLLNRARFFRMLSFGGDATYNFQPSQVSRHSITPFRLVFNVLQSTTAGFDSILDTNRALRQSMENQFIPSMRYTYTYDNSTVRRKRNNFWWQTSFTSAGNITSGIYALFGRGFKEEKNLLGASLAQFLKLTTEARYTWNIDRNQSLATRLGVGVVYAYGNRLTAPYSEQFFVGGANSIRAFTIRTIGPGTYQPAERTRYSYLDQVGDVKLEANVEYRFRIIQNLHGAVFLDAGNIWLLREDELRPGGKFTLKDFGNNIALGTGAGLRYDLSFLIIRLDCGVALHVPYETSKSGYYNIPKFKDGLGLHLAVGYPF